MRVRVQRRHDADSKAPDTYSLTIEGAGGDRKQPVRQLYLQVQLTQAGAQRLRADLGRLLPR